MARTELTAPQQQYYRLFDGEVRLFNQNEAKFFERFTDSVSTNNIDYRLTSMGTLGVAPVVNPGDGYAVRDFANPFQRTYNIKRVAIGFEVDYAVFMSDVYKDAALARGPLLAKAINLAREYDFAEFLNLATAGTAANGVLTIDGVTLASASHIIEGGTASNIVTGNPALSYSALDTAKAQMFTTVDYNGDPDTITGPFLLLVHPNNYDLAMRITETDRIQGSNDNDKNIAGQGVTVMQSPFFTSTTAWALIAQKRNPLYRIEKHGLKTNVDNSTEARDGSTLYSGVQMYGKMAKDYRGFVYSSGLGV